MADNSTTISPVLSVCATTGARVRELPIVNGQLIFVQDKHRIAFDFKDKRRFYNQIVEIDSESDRALMQSAVSNTFYFVIDTAVLWYYNNETWTQITSRPNPENVIFIGTKLPELGQAKEDTIYINKSDREIAVYDKDTNGYIIVSDYTNEVTEEDIESLFE